jgi:hypothetical protein
MVGETASAEVITTFAAALGDPARQVMDHACQLGYPRAGRPGDHEFGRVHLPEASQIRTIAQRLQPTGPHLV